MCSLAMSQKEQSRNKVFSKTTDGTDFKYKQENIIEYRLNDALRTFAAEFRILGCRNSSSTYKSASGSIGIVAPPE